MHKGEMKNRWNEQNIRWFLLDSAEEEPIPESLKPKQMEEWLKQQEKGQRQESVNSEEAKDTVEGSEKESEQNTDKSGMRGFGKYFKWWCGTLATAACLVLILFAVGRNADWELRLPGATSSDGAAEELAAADDAADAAAADGATDIAEDVQEGTTYADLYRSFDKYWTEQEEFYRDEVLYEEEIAAADDAAADDMAMDISSGGDLQNTSESMHLDKGGLEEDGSQEDSSSGDSAGKETAYGKTNQQEESVEEADIIKNDGRYLYRVVCQPESDRHSYMNRYTVKIIDTEGGLKEMALVGDYESVENIYVWKDKLVVIEPGWAELDDETESDDGIWESGYDYCRIYVYDISDRTKPREYHTFTIKGSYTDSRISDGYLYFFTSCDTQRPKTEEEVRAYVPILDGEPMDADKITLPEGNRAASYLVMASVDMEHPDTFADTHALVTSADKFYVSRSNIYMADTRYLSYEYEEEGRQSDSTVIYRYSYQDGKMRKEAQGTVKGTLRDDMAMNEYQGYLRLVTTVESQDVQKIVDDITGEVIGYDGMDEQMTNSLYVLDSDLDVAGTVEDLAPGERVYSARFMGNIGYFVTFRETDPLFSVDLSDPEDPKILGELKISGFSEYLHFYADNLLLGIGMEANEQTGETQGLKLSMFDISNPTDVKEKSKLRLEEYDYADALYNYKAVLIDTEKNIFGFYADAWEDYYKSAYLLFTFENGEFKKILEVKCSNTYSYGYDVRGTYIGDRFFLTGDSGFVEEYSLIDGSKTGELKP